MKFPPHRQAKTLHAISMKLTITFIFLFFYSCLFGQNKPLIYRNDANAYYRKNRSNNDFFEPRINEIILNSDSTFKFWGRPNESCFTWHEYQGRWVRTNDSITFYDDYEVEEN